MLIDTRNAIAEDCFNLRLDHIVNRNGEIVPWQAGELALRAPAKGVGPRANPGATVPAGRAHRLDAVSGPRNWGSTPIRPATR